MVDPVLGAVNVTIEHGGVGMKAEPVGDSVDVEPAFGRGLGAADLLTDFRMKDLGPAPRQASKPRLDELFEHLLDRLTRNLAKPLDLDGGICLDVNLRRRLPDPADD